MTNTPPMVERVARAIYEKRNGRGCTPWNHQSHAHRAPYLVDACAAIEAMREPTGDPLPISGAPFGMTRAGAAAMWDATGRGNLIGLDQAEAVWKAMISAALGEA